MDLLTQFAPGLRLPRNVPEVQVKGQRGELAFDVHDHAA